MLDLVVKQPDKLPNSEPTSSSVKVKQTAEHCLALKSPRVFHVFLICLA